MLQLIPIPSQLFKVISMDFILDLPVTPNEKDSILVIVDKMTKYALFVPTTMSLNEKETADLFFHHVVSKFGLPQQVISDQDPRWCGQFWKELCGVMGMKHALTTAHHPQANGQTEIMNQYLKIALRAFIGIDEKIENWDERLDPLALSFNSSPHSSIGFTPAYLLRGYHPLTRSILLSTSESVKRLHEHLSSKDVLVDLALEMAEEFAAKRARAQDALIRTQIAQERIYNKGQIIWEFQPRDLVVLN
jgi:hypothetical protein